MLSRAFGKPNQVFGSAWQEGGYISACGLRALPSVQIIMGLSRLIARPCGVSV